MRKLILLLTALFLSAPLHAEDWAKRAASCSPGISTVVISTTAATSHRPCS